MIALRLPAGLVHGLVENVLPVGQMRFWLAARLSALFGPDAPAHLAGVCAWLNFVWHGGPVL